MSFIHMVLYLWSGADTGELMAVAAGPIMKGFAGPGCQNEKCSDHRYRNDSDIRKIK